MTGDERGQSGVVGVALLVGIAVVSMGALTVGIGVVIDSSAAEADAERVASDLDAAIEPVAATGPQRGTVTFGEGRLRPVERTLTVRADGSAVATVDVGALVYESGDRRVAFHAGAVVRGAGEAAWMRTAPPLTVDDDVLVVSAARLGDNASAVSGTGGVTATVETDVSHSRRDLGVATFTLEVETAAPGAWARALRRRGATVDVDPGDPPTVVATFEGDRQGYLVVHDLDAEVGGGG